MQRRMILMTLLLLAISGATLGDTPEPVVPQHVIDKLYAHRQYLAERDDALWEILVDAYAKETQIKDRELAETVTQAIEDASGEFDLNP